jgi:hypothetical protein
MQLTTVDAETTNGYATARSHERTLLVGGAVNSIRNISIH